MGNASREDKPSQGVTSAFTTTTASAWSQNGIWAPHPIGSSFNAKRDAAAVSRGPDDHFPSGMTGSGALAAASEADSSSWPNRSGPWNAPDNPQTRPGSGDTSPNRPREPVGQSVLADISPASYFTSSRALGQQNSFSGQPRSNGLPALRYQSTAFNDIGVDKDTAGTFGSIGAPTPSMDKRGTRDGPYIGTVGAPSRESSMPPSRQSEVDHSSTQFGDDGMNGFGAFSSHTPNPTLSQRPNLPTHSASFPSQVNNRAYNVNSQIDEDDLAARFARVSTLPEGLDHVPNGPAYAGPSAQQFQFNPGSQPWSSDSKPYETTYSSTAYSDPTTAQFLVKRNSAERGSPAGSQFRSPKGFTNTPSSAIDAWSSRPSSRDPRADFERSRFGQPPSYLPHQAPFFPPYYAASNFPQYSGHPFEAYPSHPSYRPQIPIPPYGLHMAQYMPAAAAVAGGAPGVPALKDQDRSKSVRSSLLDEFRAKSNKKYELKDIYNHIVEFSGDQHGSRFIQNKLETANSDEKDQVFREIEPNAMQLMKDVFGNYVVQKFFEHGNQVQKKILAGVMKGKMVDLSCQMYACRVVQKAMEHILVEQQIELVSELHTDVVRIIKDQNGNHVIQKVIEVVPRAYTRFIMDALRGSISQMSAHSYGCRVIQRLMEHSSDADKACILSEIHACAQFLVTDQYGNYVTQHVLVHGNPEDRHKMISIIVPQLLTLSKHKFASNVVEKCIEFGSEEDRQAILDQLYSKASDGTSSLQLLVRDQFGNYVIQKFLKSLQGPERERFVEELKPCVAAMKKVSTGRTVNALDKLIQLATNPNTKVNGENPSESDTRKPLQIDPNSAIQTPVLTREPNTPQSSDPPSTNVSAVGDVASDGVKGHLNGTGREAEIQVSPDA